MDFLLERSTENQTRAVEQMFYKHRYQQIKQQYEWMAYNGTASGVTHVQYGNQEVIISLTTHSKRIHTVYSTIESLFQQSCKANRIVLWLSEKEYSADNLPESLKMQMKRGLEVRFCKDVRSYTKLVPALQAFPEAVIITVDDDYWYPRDFVERMLRRHQEEPAAICCIEVREILQDAQVKFVDFNRYPRVFDRKDVEHNEKHYLLEGYAGVLYPPHALHEDACNEKLFLELAPTNDDLWFTVMAHLQGTRRVVVGIDCELTDYITLQDDIQDIGLFNINQSGAFNEQLNRLFEYYRLAKNW